MSKKSPKISYDKESEMLSIEFKKAKSVDSDINEHAVIDYDKNGNIVRINLYHFNFSDFRNGLKAIKDFGRGDIAVAVK